MVNDLPWRKVPRDIIRNEDLDYISYLLDDSLKPAPLLFYITAYCKADDFGVFDIEDGVIFSRLMRIGKPADVKTIAEAMVKRHLIRPVADNCTSYVILDWEVPQRKSVRTSKTAEERRKTAEEKIQQEQEEKAYEQPEPPKDIVAELYGLNENDKNEESVVSFCPQHDKNTKSVESYREREIRENRGDEIETHTQFSQPEKIRQTEIVKESKLDLEEKTIKAEESPVSKQLSLWFKKNCLGFEESKAIYVLANRIYKLEDEKNSADTITALILAEYKKLCTESAYYKGMQMSPENLLKNGAYSHVLAAVSKILVTKQTNAQEWAKQIDPEELKQDKAVENEIDNECKKYGIDASRSDRMVLLLHARAGRAEGG